MNRATQGIALAATLVLSSSLAVTRARLQSLGSRIDAVREPSAHDVRCADGSVRQRLSWYRSRDGGRSGQFDGMWNGGNDVENSCEQGPVRVVALREGGDTKEIRTYVGGRWRG